MRRNEGGRKGFKYNLLFSLLIVTQTVSTCLCIGKDDSSAILSNCNASSSRFEWFANGILKQDNKCLRPEVGAVAEGTSLVFSDSCDQSDVAFKLTPRGAIQHRRSLLCVQPVKWIEAHGNDELVLGKGCHIWLWSFSRIPFKGICM